MVAFLVTGNPGAGKSRLAEEFRRRGVAVIDPDDDRELSYWVNEQGGRVSLDDSPPDPDQAWLRSHRWVWDRPRMEQLIAAEDGPVFVCGIALNIGAVLDLFAAVFLLELDEATQEHRLLAYDLHHSPGRTESQRQQIREGRSVFQTQMREMGAVVIDGRSATGAIGDDILADLARRSQ